MLKSLLVFAILICAVSTTARTYQADWVRVEPLGGGFSVMMPAKPEEKVEPSDQFTFHLFTVTTSKAIYLASYGDYAPSIKLDPEGELLANRDNFLKGVNAKLIESHKINLDGRAALEFTGESDQASFKSRVYLFGNRVHQIAVAVFKGQDDPDGMNRFFASFSFSTNQEHPKP